MSKTGLSIVDDMIDVVLDFYKRVGRTDKDGDEYGVTNLWNEYTVKEFETVYTVATLYTKIMENPYLLHIFDIEKIKNFDIYGITKYKANGIISSIYHKNFGDSYIPLKECIEDVHSHYVPTVTKAEFDEWVKIMIEKKLITDEQLMDAISLVYFPEDELTLH
ncbi:hypothetical protein [Niallia taxi]|uniref:hypothetical protein n=1 Tax=Niallia taxi TaxID=2499688 RepID=UPI0015F560C4|nr:hypothetical protein [Niallia taxi]